MNAGTPLVAIAVLALAGACGNEKPKQKAAKVEGEASAGFIGVDPSVFRCETIAPVPDVGVAIGGQVERMESMFTPPKGTPVPCDYAQIGLPPPVVQDGAPAPAQPMWSIRFDCREDHMPGTTKEMERLATEEGATRVTVGKLAVDHLNAALLFVDDDSPCTVRVVGPNPDQRLAIARLVADRLTPRTAPMTPRPAP
jgi:hypothetical protein